MCRLDARPSVWRRKAVMGDLRLYPGTEKGQSKRGKCAQKGQSKAGKSALLHRHLIKLHPAGTWVSGLTPRSLTLRRTKSSATRR